MNLQPRTVFVLILVALWAAELSPAQSGGSLAPASAASSASQEVPAPVNSPPAATPLASPDPNIPTPASRSAARPQDGKGGKGKGAPAVVEEAPPEEGKPYVIGSLDILEIKVWNDPKLSGIFDVRPDGMLSLPLVGEMKADGLTVLELTQLIKTKLAASVMEDPEVNIQVARINSKKFYIFGGCTHLGEFPLVGTMTFLDAFASCGGFKDFANPKKTYILRGGQRLYFNYKDVSQGKHMEQNRRLQNGDRIFVPE